MKIDIPKHVVEHEVLGTNIWEKNTSGIHYNDGYTGFGTDTPEYKVHTQTTGEANTFLQRSDAGGFGNFFIGQRCDGTIASPTATHHGRTLFSLEGGGYNGTDWVESAAYWRIRAKVDGGTWAVGDNPTEHIFAITSNGTTAFNEILRIDENGLWFGTGIDNFDVNLFRNGANVLQTNDNFVAGSNFTIGSTIKVNAILDEDDMTSNSNLALATQQSIKKYVDDNSGGYDYYDAVIASSDGDYTSIVTGLATEGANKSIFVKRGTYTETANVVVSNGQKVHFDNVVIALGSGYKVNMLSTSDSVFTGKLELQGDGANCQLLDCRGDDNNAENCTIRLTPTANLPMVSDTRVVYLDGARNRFNFIGEGITFTSSNAAWPCSVISTNCTHSQINLVLDTMTLNGGTGAASFRGIDAYNDFNIYKVLINDVTTTTGNTGRGVQLNVGADYNCVTGVSRGCDSSPVTDGGTGNKTGEVAV